jgi:hypothetical protein
MQAGGGRGNGTALVGEYCLVAVTIGFGVVAMDVWRQRRVADGIEYSEEVVNEGELEQTLAELAALEDFGLKRDGSRRRWKNEALADGDFPAGTNESAPAVVACRFGEHDFDAAGWFFSIPN